MCVGNSFQMGVWKGGRPRSSKDGRGSFFVFSPDCSSYGNFGLLGDVMFVMCVFEDEEEIAQERKIP